MEKIPEPGGKSLLLQVGYVNANSAHFLLQTVALFETLLSKISAMKAAASEAEEERARLAARLELACTAETRLVQTEADLQAVNEVVFNYLPQHWVNPGACL